MPLEHSRSPDAFKRNVKTLMGDIGKSPHVASREQALAIAYATQRRGRAPGGMVMPQGANNLTPPSGIMGGMGQMPMGGAPQGGGGIQTGPMTPIQPSMPIPSGNLPYEPTTPFSGIGSNPSSGLGVQGGPIPETPQHLTFGGGFSGGGQGMMSINSPLQQHLDQWGQNHPTHWTQNNQNGGNLINPGDRLSTPSGGDASPAGISEPMTPFQPGVSPVASRNRADGGSFNMAKSPHMSTPWQVRSEARGMGVHTGYVNSTVPGRTDHHSTSVPSGSYVIPADVVSGRGQGNSAAGAKALSAMFKTGPYGTSIPHLGHGAGIPKGPRLQKVAASGGGKSGDGNMGEPTPVNIAGGEVVVPPESLLEVVHPDLDTAHRIMDSWVLHERANHIKTLRGLPGPAKD